MKLKQLVVFALLIIWGFGFTAVYGEFPKITEDQLSRLYDKLSQLKAAKKPEQFEKLVKHLSPRLKELQDALKKEDLKLDPFADEENRCPNKQNIMPALDELLKLNGRDDYSSLSCIFAYLREYNTKETDCDPIAFYNLYDAVLRINRIVDTVNNSNFQY